MPNVHIRVGVADIDIQIGGIVERLTDLTPFWKQVARICRQAFARNFRVGGVPPWTPLSLNTIKQKNSLGVPSLGKGFVIPKRLMQRGDFGGANSILIRSGALRDSLANQSAKGNITQIIEDGLVIGTTIPYAIYHQMGDTKTGRHPPRRPMTTLTNDDIHKIVVAGTRYISGADIQIGEIE